MITNMYIANDSLPNETKARIERSTATHLWGWNTGGGTSTLKYRAQSTHRDIIHTVVRV